MTLSADKNIFLRAKHTPKTSSPSSLCVFGGWLRWLGCSKTAKKMAKMPVFWPVVMVGDYLLQKVYIYKFFNKEAVRVSKGRCSPSEHQCSLLSDKFTRGGEV